MNMKSPAWLSIPLLCAVLSLAVGIHPAAPDVPFVQEYHEAYPIQPGGPGDDVRAIAVDSTGRIWAATRGGVYGLIQKEWKLVDGFSPGPAYALYCDDSGIVWAGAWDGLYRIENGRAVRVPEVTDAVSAVHGKDGHIIALGPDGAWECVDARWQGITRRWSGNIRDVLVEDRDTFWIATGMGLYRRDPTGLRLYCRDEDLYSSEVNALAFTPGGRLWVGELGGIDIFENGVRVDTLTAEDDLPYYDVRALAHAPDGRMWIGTGLGAARYQDGLWSLRHSRRWLLNDEVRDIAFDSEGAAWIATAAGVSAIKNRWMTLHGKAEYYLDICLKRHVREPGFVEKCFFPNPADQSIFVPRDDDNDGSYTSFYMVMECFRYAATQNPQAKANADKAFAALELLQTITGTPGFVARTIIPADWTAMADPNQTYTPQERIESRVRNPRFKPVEQRWRLSSDKKWLWKGDTSSDEITGHMFGYLFYYDLAADDAHKARVRNLVSRIMDYIIEGGYVLRDIDGQPTRWGVWSPEKLNHDPDWRVEAPINSFEFLSYLKAAYHITGNPKYQQEYKKLIEKHGYAENARRPKNYERAQRTHIDDELLMFAAPALLLYEDDPRLLSIYKEAFTWAYRTVENDQNPFFNFMYGFLGGENFHLEESIQFLQDQPLDLVQWRVDNATREDVKLVRFPMLEPLQLDWMLPPSERGIMRWDKNPWETVSGDFSDEPGRLESSGVFWLMPYWMGRHLGYIGLPEK
ncbi:MAG: two-component regulator propeller domain-containing protein [bacterium]